MTTHLSPPEPGFRILPKIDLHRHLEGSLRLATLLEVAKHAGMDLSPEAHALQAQVQISSADPKTYTNFLSKFKILRDFFCSPELIQRFVGEAIEDAAIDQVRYLELFFTPPALAQSCGFSLAEVVKWVLDAAHRASSETGTAVSLITSVNRHEPLALAEEVVDIALQYLDRGIVGLNLAGNEADFPADPFERLFREAQAAGLNITVHAGEWAGAESVGYALQHLGAQRIGHGVRILEDRNIVAIARERRTCFEVCLTSNLQSGVIHSMMEHPLPEMIQAGLQVTLNTDDPGISNITLSDEYAVARDELGLSWVTLVGMTMAAAQAAFLNEQKRRALEERLEETFFSLG